MNIIISETLISVVQMPSRKELNKMFSTAQDSVITEGYEQHGGSGEKVLLLCFTLPVLLLLLLVLLLLLRLLLLSAAARCVCN